MNLLWEAHLVCTYTSALAIMCNLQALQMADSQWASFENEKNVAVQHLVNIIEGKISIRCNGENQYTYSFFPNLGL